MAAASIACMSVGTRCVSKYAFVGILVAGGLTVAVALGATMPVVTPCGVANCIAWTGAPAAGPARVVAGGCC